MCLGTRTLKFLDIVNYIAPRCRYFKYLKTYKNTEMKGYFCYEYIADLRKVDETKLPQHEALYSKLKKSQYFSGGVC